MEEVVNLKNMEHHHQSSVTELDKKNLASSVCGSKTRTIYGWRQTEKCSRLTNPEQIMPRFNFNHDYLKFLTPKFYAGLLRQKSH